MRRPSLRVAVLALSAGIALGAGGDAPRAARTPQRALVPTTYDPGEAMRFRLRSLMDENGNIPMDGLERAKAHVEEMRAHAAADRLPAAGITRTTWTWRGPGNVGGRTRALAIHPTNPSIVFAATAGGGIWKTINGGASWAPVDDFMASLAVTTIVFKPGDPATMFAGTGEFGPGDGIQGAGIFRSSDGGATWAQLSSTNNSNFNYVSRLSMSADGSIILAATEEGVFRSVTAGVTWTKALGAFASPFVSDVTFLPGSNTRAVASGYTGTASFSADGGATFTASSLPGIPGFRRVELAVSPSAPNNVYAMIDVASSNAELWKSTNGGATYAFVSTNGHLIASGYYANSIWVDPTNDSVVVIGGIDLHRSIDGGVTFTPITSSTGPGSVHIFHHAIVADVGYNGTTNRRVYVANDGGVYKTENIMTAASGSGFTSLNNNFGATQFYGAAGHAGTGRITGGTANTGDLFSDPAAGLQGWVDRHNGLYGGRGAYDPIDGNVFYGQSLGLFLHRNTTGGASLSEDIWGFDSVSGSCRPEPYAILDACNSAVNFLAPFILDPNDPNTMLAGGASLWRSPDVKAPFTNLGGPRWFSIKPPVVTGFSAYISAIAVAPGNSAVIYTGHNNGDIYRTLNGTAATPSWTKVDAAAMPTTMVLRLAVDPFNVNNVYAAFGSFAATNLWRSTDGGVTWNLSMGSGATGLPNVPIRAIALHPTRNGWIYVGTEVGIFASADGGATWGVPHDGPANVSVDDLSFMGTTLIAATHGRGVYTSAANFFPTDLSLDSPANGTTIVKPFTVSGWAINRGATSGTGVDAVHIYVTPTGGGASIFLGAATYGTARSDIGALYGAQFTNSGYALRTGASLTPGGYVITAYAHNALTATFDAARSVTVTVTAPPSDGLINIDSPINGQLVTSAFEIGGWAIDRAAASGTGVDAIQFYIFPNDGASPGVFVGNGSYGAARTDVGAAYGSRFTNSGYHFTITGLGPGNFLLGAYARSTVTETYSVVKTVHVTVNPNQLMSIDTPGPEATFSAPAFDVAGWSIDRAVATGTGVDSLHVYAYPNPGSGQAPIFLGVATVGFARSDVAALYGARFTNSGYNLRVDRVAVGMTPGVYSIVVHSHSTSGSFNNLAVVRITVQ